MIRRHTATLALMGSLLGAALCPAQTPVPATWKAGTATAVITPKTNMWMAGYASRTAPSEGADTDLFAKALVLEDPRGARVALVSLDLVSVPRSVRLAVAAQVEKQFALPPSNLVLNASHTHCGPELRVWRTGKTDDSDQRAAEADAYCAALQSTLIRLVGDAIAGLAPAQASYSQARCGFAMNRRTPLPGGGFKNFPNPAGPVDHRVPVLRIRSAATAKDLAIAFGYACHCTTLGYQKFNGDYAAYAQRAIEAAHPGAAALFINGCSGDQNPYPRRKLEYAQAHGQSLALAVETALETEMKPVTGTLRAAFLEIPLPYDTLPTRPELETRAKSADKLDAALAANLLGRLDAGESLPASYPYPVQVLRIGDSVTFVSLAGEVVVDYSLRLQKELRDPFVWVAGYCNDVMTYIPSRRVWLEGGYEGADAMKYNFHPARWAPGIEDLIIQTVHSLRGRLD